MAWSPFTSLLDICFIPRGQGGHATCPWSPALPTFLSGLHAPRACDHRHSTGRQVPCEQPLGSPDSLPNHRGHPYMCGCFSFQKNKCMNEKQNSSFQFRVSCSCHCHRLLQLQAESSQQSWCWGGGRAGPHMPNPAPHLVSTLPSPRKPRPQGNPPQPPVPCRPPRHVSLSCSAWKGVLAAGLHGAQAVWVPSLVAQTAKSPPAMLETWVQSLGLEDMKYPTYNLNEQCNNTQP